MFQVIDLCFQGEPGIIASYVLRGPGGVVLVETGPASTYPRLLDGLRELGIEPREVSDILVTHIHLDHAGAAGWLAQETGARVHVHHVGASHLADPSRLLASAARIYGDQMGPLWGETRPVPADQVHALDDEEVVEAAGFQLKALDTPGHAYHHMAYLWEGLCFTGDVAAVRLAGQRHIRVPTPPPEINLPLWHSSLARLHALRPDRLLLSHFGPLDDDPQDHLQGVGETLEAAAALVQEGWLAGLEVKAITQNYVAWSVGQATAQGADPDAIHRYEVIVPSVMEVEGLLRYWRRRERNG